MLTETQLKVYISHGEALAKYPVSVKRLARELKVTEWTVRMVKAFAKEHGPPVDLGALHLVVGDAHAKPGTSLERFTWLGKVIEDLGREALSQSRPFRLILIGDWFDLPSLSYYDRGKASSHGRTYAADIAAGEEAFRLTRAEVSKKVWRYADKHLTLGNHDFRADRHMQDNPELQGVLGDPTEVAAAIGFTVHPFLEWVQLDGVGYAHYMGNPGSGRPVSGVNQARSMALKGYRSCTVGHSHRLSMYTAADVYGDPVQTLCCGCYFDHHEVYAAQSNQQWWRGLVVKRHVRNGSYDLETITLDSLRRKYANP